MTKKSEETVVADDGTLTRVSWSYRLEMLGPVDTRWTDAYRQNVVKDVPAEHDRALTVLRARLDEFMNAGDYARHVFRVVKTTEVRAVREEIVPTSELPRLEEPETPPF